MLKSHIQICKDSARHTSEDLLVQDPDSPCNSVVTLLFVTQRSICYRCLLDFTNSATIGSASKSLTSQGGSGQTSLRGNEVNAMTHHNVAYGCNAGADCQDGQQAGQPNVEALEWQ